MRALATGFLFLAVLAGADWAAAEDRAQLRERLFAELAAAETEAEANAVTTEIWRMWFTPPSEEIGAMVDEATHQRIIGNFKAALAIWDAIVIAAPDWSEGWNQRATLHYRMSNYEASLSDIAETLKREPKHFGALAGKAQIELFLGRPEVATETLREAVEIHPWIAGRELIDKGPGVDL